MASKKFKSANIFKVEMKKPLFIGIALVAMNLSASAWAQTAGQFMNNPAFTGQRPAQCISTLEMQQCAAHDLRDADAEMSKHYAELRATLSTAARKTLLTEQRAWLKSRDRDCVSKGRSGGTMASVAVASCWVEVTKSRSSSLEKELGSKVNSAAPLPASAFLGRWRGGEGTVMKITREGNRLLIDNQWGLDADMHGKFVGTITADGLRFERNGVTETVRPGMGDSVNRSALRGKKDCLVVSRDEGYCRY
ncbi:MULTISPECIES: lysozyme inhibitor LprI family protein [unclassified Acidovorax]|uniref:lysozyme inhibitor LprI family protein n=1 Tax=unclassified Acidovorax TaxID=2684926 RepID=UPI00138F27AA|nr:MULTISPECIES: lysozyme inhibitor LprI family protein [unclassified Acidovorax]